MEAVLSTPAQTPQRYVWPERAPQFRAVEDLEAEITELWGHVNAATYRFLELVADYDRRQGWALHGLANCAQWLNWQCGIGAVAAREKVRVARALEMLPEISDAFRRGVLSYSKIRAVTRIANPENEPDLLNIAISGTAAHVERLVGKYRRVERLEDAARANETHRSRSLYYFYDDDGSMVIHAKLPPEVGEIVRKAIEDAVRLAEKQGEPITVAGSDAVLRNGAPSTAAPAVTQSHGIVSAGTFEVEKTAEPAHSSADRTEPHDAISAKRADALRLLAECFLTRQSDALGSVADRVQVVVHIDQRLLAVGASSARDCALVAASSARDIHCELEDGRALALETVRRLACDASIVGMVDNEHGEPLNVGRKTRSIPPALQRALKARDGGCRFPGCTHTRFTEGHHVKHWADGGETKLDNLITLCRFHHRVIHEGGFGLHVLDDGAERDRFVFTRPDGTRIEANGRECFRGNNSAGSAREPGGAAELELLACHRESGLAIDWQTSRCRWMGETMDYGLAIGALLQRRDLAARRGPMSG